MSKGYFIVLPEGHDEKVYLDYLEIVKSVSGIATRIFPYTSSATYLVVRPDEPDTVRRGSLGTALRRLREDPNMVELHSYMENV